MVTPALPAGYQLDQAGGMPPLPSGYQLDSKAAQPSGVQLSNPSTVPNARIRNWPNPAANETSPGEALYHGAKTGLMLASIPAAATASIPALVTGTAGAVVGGVAGKQIAKASGAGEFGQEVAGDAGAVAGGALTAGATDWAATKARAVYEALPPAVQKELVGIISPRWAHAAKIADALGIGKEPPPVYPGAPNPETPPQEVLQAQPLSRGGQRAIDPSGGLGNIPVRPPAANPGAAGSMVESVTASQPAAARSE